jgi:hypothetical protein
MSGPKKMITMDDLHNLTNDVYINIDYYDEPQEYPDENKYEKDNFIFKFCGVIFFPCWKW